MSFSIIHFLLLSVLFLASSSFAAKNEQNKTRVNANLMYTLEGATLEFCSHKTTEAINSLVLKSLNFLLLEREADTGDGALFEFDAARIISESMKIVPVVAANEGADRGLSNQPITMYSDSRFWRVRVALSGQCMSCPRNNKLTDDAVRRSLRGSALNVSTIDTTDTDNISRLEQELAEVFGALLVSKTKKFSCLAGFTDVAISFD